MNNKNTKRDTYGIGIKTNTRVRFNRHKAYQQKYQVWMNVLKSRSSETQQVVKGVDVLNTHDLQGKEHMIVDEETCRDVNDFMRKGGLERKWLLRQASKTDSEQDSIRSTLKPLDMEKVDVLIVGCGPAGLSIASEIAKRGIDVGLIGHDAPFVNTYGVWQDEFEELGLEKCLERVFDDAVCFFGEKDKECVSVGRKYAKVDRKILRDVLLERCQASGVSFHEGHVTSIETQFENERREKQTTYVKCKNGETFLCSLVILAAGAASSKFLEYEEGVPNAGAQTAYGFEVTVDKYPFDPLKMHFMDFRRHHTGLWSGKALHPGASRALDHEGSWGSSNEVPSFLYAMSLGGNKAFFQETCLVSKEGVPFNVLERRLKSRLSALGVEVKSVLDEEWSYIPVGGPLPLSSQSVVAFGAAANFIHPATGYSISRSLKSAPDFAEHVSIVLKEKSGWNEKDSIEAWEKLWSLDNRKQAAFHLFGMELLASLDVKTIDDFFLSFFNLPSWLWKGFLSSSLGSNTLIFFALHMFVIASFSMKAKLVQHLLFDPAGKYVIEKYLKY